MIEAVADRQGRELAEGLGAYLAAQQVPNPRITGLRRLTGGSSHDTWAFDLGDGENPAAATRPLIMRRNFGESALDLSPEAEFRLLRWLHDEGIPVARPCYCATADSPFASPFVLSERLEGVDLRKVMAQAGKEMDRRAIGLLLVGLQARIHALDPHRLPDGIFGDDLDASRREVFRWTKLLLEVDGGHPSPLQRAAIAWLRANVPALDRPALVHGDFKANNILWHSAGTPALLDWELAHIGDPLEDLAWTMLWATKDDLVGGMLLPDAYVAAYEASSGRPVDRRRLFFWQLFVLVKLSAVMLTGSCTAMEPERLGPSHAMLARGAAWLEAAMADYLTAAISGRAGR